jgi:alpha-1,6-mannosyltransferase
VLALLLAALRDIARPLIWSALYWWNPLVIKELFNSGHMEAVVMAPVLLALLLAVRQRPIAAVTALGIAAGAKVWPVLLLPLLVRPLVADWRRLVIALAVFAVLGALWMWPIWLGGLDQTSGFVAYATKWQTNSAFFPVLEKSLGGAAGLLGASPDWGNKLLRSALALAIGGFALWLAWKPSVDATQLLRRAALICAALVLLSPAQYPWYAIWFLPFLVFLPLRTFLVLTATLPLYYTFFHFNAREHPEVFRNWIVWAIWLPAWTALVLDLRQSGASRMRPSP